MSQVASSDHSVVEFCRRSDLALLRLCVPSGRNSMSRWLAIALSWMGNGLIYPMMALGLILSSGARAIIPIGTSAVNAGILHSLYPVIKSRIGRIRPYRSHSDLTSLLRVLDEHSFPSGHAMTLTAVLVPIAMAVPGTFSASVVLWGTMAWARVASAHHYPSDIAGGTAIALFISYPSSCFCFAVAASF